MTKRLRLKAYYYIEAREVEGRVSFAHLPVSAKDESEAYEEGARLMTSMRLLKALSQREHGKGKFLNDYVIEVPL